ncbi:hypothetical protein BCEP27_80292 [Burkholderia cepacia]
MVCPREMWFLKTVAPGAERETGSRRAPGARHRHCCARTKVELRGTTHERGAGAGRAGAWGEGGGERGGPVSGGTSCGAGGRRKAGGKITVKVATKITAKVAGAGSSCCASACGRTIRRVAAGVVRLHAESGAGPPGGPYGRCGLAPRPCVD